MASGKAHTRINLAGISLATPLVAFWGALPGELLSWAALSAVFGTLFLSPDLDLKQSRSMQAWGWFRWLWYAYHRCFGHRRSSHVLFLGTLTRLLYLAGVGFFAVLLLEVLRYCWDGYSLKRLLGAQESVGMQVRGFLIWTHTHRQECQAFFAGLVFADTLHLLTDLVYSGLKKIKVLK